MKYNNYYVVKVFYPTEFTKYTECGSTFDVLCEKINDNTYLEPKNNITYTFNNIVGFTKIEKVTPLSHYFYRIGLKKKNNYNNKEEVYKLVKDLKKYEKE